MTGLCGGDCRSCGAGHGGVARGEETAPAVFPGAAVFGEARVEGDMREDSPPTDARMGDEEGTREGGVLVVGEERRSSILRYGKERKTKKFRDCVWGRVWADVQKSWGGTVAGMGEVA